MSGSSSLSDESELSEPSQSHQADSEGDPVPLDLHTACSLGKYELARALIRTALPSQLNGANAGGWTALMYAAYIGHDSIVKLLVSEKAVNVNQANSSGQTSLMLAVGCGNEIAATLLHDAGANLESRDSNDWTPLFHATYNGHENMVRFLCESRANIDAVEKRHGCTPLMLASSEGHEIIVQCLLEAGADQHIKNKAGDTARALALGKHYMKIVSLIDGYSRYTPSPVRGRSSPGGESAAARSGAANSIDTGPSEMESVSRAMSDMALHPPPFLMPTAETLSRVATVLSGTHVTPSPARKPWPRNVREILDYLNLSKYAPVFESQDIDLPVFFTMTENDLMEIGVTTLGPRRKITTLIARWHNNALRTGADPLEKTYADSLQMRLQDVVGSLQQAIKQLDAMDGCLNQERGLRAATEQLLVERKASLETLVGACAENRGHCHAVFEGLTSIAVCTRKLHQQTEGLTGGAASAGSSKALETIAQATATATQTVAVILKNIEKLLQRTADGDSPYGSAQ